MKTDTTTFTINKSELTKMVRGAVIDLNYETNTLTIVPIVIKSLIDEDLLKLDVFKKRLFNIRAWSFILGVFVGCFVMVILKVILNGGQIR